MYGPADRMTTLIFTTFWASSGDDKLILFSFFPGYDFSCKLSPNNIFFLFAFFIFSYFPQVIVFLFFLGPVVQSFVSLTSSLRVISLTVLADSIHNILIFFAEKM